MDKYVKILSEFLEADLEQRFSQTKTFFPQLKLFFIHPNDMLLLAFQNSVPACVKTDVGWRFVVNSAFYKISHASLHNDFVELD